jgi:hypothetical protein
LSELLGREEQFDVEKLMHFPDGTQIVLLKNHTVPQRWLLWWMESDGTVGKRKGHSELVFKCTYREICERLATPEINQISDQLFDAEGTPKDIGTDERLKLIKRWYRLRMADDKRVDGEEAKHEALVSRINRLREQPGKPRCAMTRFYLSAKPERPMSATQPRYAMPKLRMPA